LIVSVAFPALAFMPQSFYDRLNTFYSLRNDLSYQGRLTAWQVGYDVAVDRFPMGAGFQGPEQDGLYHTYFPDEPSRAAHSIYFQVLGEHGFVGLAMYIVILLMAFAHTRKIRKLTRQHPELSWAHNLATMIQLSLLAFCSGGAALSDAYYDLFWIWLGLLPALKSVVSQIVRQQVRVPVGLPAFASI
jgi:putative inorganic carbon (HCO3(-)) transporter